MGKARLLTQTSREKLGYLDGINLFFGALLGANLGTLGTMPLGDYIMLIAVLAGLVMAIRAVSLSDRRLYSIGMLAFCLAIMALFLFVPALQPEGLSGSDLDRLTATLLIWVATAVLVEFYPTRDAPAPEDQA